MKKRYDLIIVGSGPAGIYSAFLSSMHNINCKIIEASSEYGGQMLLFKDKPVYDMPGFVNSNGRDILNSLKLQLDSSGIKIDLNEKLLSIEGEYPNFYIKTTIDEYRSKCVILSTGGGFFESVKLGIKNEEAFSNIKYHVENYEHYKNKNLVIFGGGDSAIDWTHFFMKICKNVNLVHRRNKFRGQEKLLNEIKQTVEINTPYKIQKVNGKNNASSVEIININTKEIKLIECDEILVFFGQKKIIEKDIDYKILQENNRITVNSNMETSRKGIFAIGNIATYNGKISTLSSAMGEASTAVGAVIYKVFSGKKMSYYVKKKDN